jgi:hypothetical protein
VLESDMMVKHDPRNCRWCLRQRIAALEQERNELLTLRTERCTLCGEPSPTFCVEHNPEIKRLRTALADAFRAGTEAGAEVIEQLLTTIAEWEKWEEAVCISDSFANRTELGKAKARLRALRGAQATTARGVTDTKDPG